MNLTPGRSLFAPAVRLADQNRIPSPDWITGYTFTYFSTSF